MGDTAKQHLVLVNMKYTSVIALLPAALGHPGQQQTIAELAADLAKIPKSWTSAGSSRFPGDKKPSDFAYLNGALEIPEHMNLPVKDIKIATDIPASFDPRDTWGAMCPSLLEIRDQGSCGSCWAFGAAAAFTDRQCIQTNGASTQDYSAEDILSCCKSCGMGCNGGYDVMAWNWLMSNGAVTGGLYEGTGCKPYSIAPCEHHTEGDRVNCEDVPHSSTPKCSRACVDGSTDYTGDKKMATSVYRVGGPRNLEAIQTELMTNGPVEVSFSVYEDFMTYTGGVYYHVTGSGLGGHAVKMMGWGTDADTGMDYWLIGNSWNSDWAEDGFFRIRRGTNECGIEGKAFAGMVV